MSPDFRMITRRTASKSLFPLWKNTLLLRFDVQFALWKRTLRSDWCLDNILYPRVSSTAVVHNMVRETLGMYIELLLLLFLLLRRTGNPVTEERNSAVQTRLSLLGLQGVWKGMMEYPQNMRSLCIRSKTLAMTTAQLR